MDEGMGNLELLPREGCDISDKLREEGSNVIGVPGFEGQKATSRDFLHTSHVGDVVQEKGEERYDKNGILELVSSKESGVSENPREAGSKAVGLIQPVVMCEPSSIIARSTRLPLVDLSNISDTPMCSFTPQKPSWTGINRGYTEPDAKLEIAVGIKRVSPPKQKTQQGTTKKTKLSSQTGKENAVILVEASIQPYQEL